MAVDGEKDANVDVGEQQRRVDLEKGGPLIRATLPSAIPVLNLATTTNTTKPRTRVRRLLVFLAIVGFVFHATTRVFKRAGDGARFVGPKSKGQQVHGMMDAFVHRAQHVPFGKKAEELFLSVPLFHLFWSSCVTDALCAAPSRMKQAH